MSSFSVTRKKRFSKYFYLFFNSLLAGIKSQAKIIEFILDFKVVGFTARFVATGTKEPNNLIIDNVEPDILFFPAPVPNLYFSPNIDPHLTPLSHAVFL